MADDASLPAGLLVETVLRNLTVRGVPYYILQKGNYGSGLILIKLNGLSGDVRLLTQQRNFIEDVLEWVDATGEELLEEAKADAYIQRAIRRDPDLWVIEVEDQDMINPFEERERA